MFDDPLPDDSLSRLDGAALGAASAWARARRIRAAILGLAGGLIGAAVVLLVREFSSQLRPSDLPMILTPVVLGPLVGIALGWRRPSLAAAARQWDHRAGLFDRVSTALEFGRTNGDLVPGQRADTLHLIDGLDPRRAFPVELRGPLDRVLAAAVLLLAFLCLALLREPRPEGPPAAPESAADALVEFIDDTLAPSAPPQRPASSKLLRELRAQVRSVQAQQKRLKKVVATRPPDPVAPTAEPPTPSPTAPPPATPKTMTAADLEHLEKLAADAMLGATPAEQQMVAQLFSQTRQSMGLIEQFHELVEREEAASQPPPSRGGAMGPVGSSVNDKMNGDMIGKGALSDRLGGVPDEKKREDMIRQDLGKDAQAEHDLEHALQQEFQQFLKEVVKDVQDAVKKAALGKRDKKARGGSMKGGGSMDNKRDEMNKSGFRDADRPPDQKNKQASRPADPGKPAGPGEPGDGDGAASTAPPPPGTPMAEGAPPAGMQPGPGPAAGPGAGTSAGAQGAGSGSEDPTGTQFGIPEGGGGSALERLLGQVGQGGLPPERKELLWNRLARHKVESRTPQSEADDVLLDYFGQAEDELADHEEAMSPVLAAYARMYLDSIRPGRTEAHPEPAP